MNESNFSNENKRSKSFKKERAISTTEMIDENADLDVSVTMEDDVSKDPDWMNTPLYNRIQKLQVIIMHIFNYDYYYKYLMIFWKFFVKPQIII